MERIGTGISILLFAILLSLSGMGIIALVVGVIGLGLVLKSK